MMSKFTETIHKNLDRIVAFVVTVILTVIGMLISLEGFKDLCTVLFVGATYKWLYKNLP